MRVVMVQGKVRAGVQEQLTDSYLRMSLRAASPMPKAIKISGMECRASRTGWMGEAK